MGLSVFCISRETRNPQTLFKRYEYGMCIHHKTLSPVHKWRQSSGKGRARIEIPSIPPHTLRLTHPVTHTPYDSYIL